MPILVRIAVVLLVAIGVAAWVSRGPALLLESAAGAFRAFCM